MSMMKSVPLEIFVCSAHTCVFNLIQYMQEYKCILAFFGLCICSMAEVILFDRLKTGFWIGGIDGSTKAHNFLSKISYSHYISKKNFGRYVTNSISWSYHVFRVFSGFASHYIFLGDFVM